jgi:hypothetical protein
VLAQRFGWGPNDLFAMTPADFAFWVDAINERDRVDEQRAQRER